jgi:hypothetical protein
MPPAIAIIGSVDTTRTYDPPLKVPEIALAAAREIGRYLAEEGWRIIVYSSSEAFVEREVVAGFIESGKAAANTVEIYGRSGQTNDFPGMAEHPKCFRVVPEISDDWEVGYYRSLFTIDAMLLVGGGRSTLISGILALSRGIAAAPIATFGGAAQRVWERFNPDRDLATEEDIAAMNGPWHEGAALAVVASIGAQHRRARKVAVSSQRAERVAMRRSAISLTAAFGLLVVGLATIPAVYTLPAGTWSSLSLLVLGPFLTSISGAIIRNAADGGRNWMRAAVLGAGAGAVAFLLFVAAQIATNPSMLTADDSVRRLVVFTLAVGFVGGFTSETVYAKLRDENVIESSAIHRPVNGNP